MRPCRFLPALFVALLAVVPARADPPNLRAGVAIAHWWRFPGRADRAWLTAYLDDMTLARLRNAGLDHVRLPIDPALATARPAWLAESVARIIAAGLTVIVVPTAIPPEGLAAWWRATAAALPDDRRVVAEPLNEPTITPPAWDQMQRQTVDAIRAVRPHATLLLTGARWGGIDGLREADRPAVPNALWSFHFYEPAELTSLAAYRPELDHRALAALPFPAGPCPAPADAATRAVAAFYCGLHWNDAKIADRIDQATGPGLHLGEFGATRLLPEATRLAWLRAVRRAAEARGIGWTLWAYDNDMGFDSTLDAPTLRALGLTPQVTP